MHELAIPLEVA